MKSKTAKIYKGITYYYVKRDNRFISKDRKRLSREIWKDNCGPIPDGMVVHHKNGDSSDDSPSNLQLMTPSGHHRHHFNVSQNHPEVGGLTKESINRGRQWHKTKEGQAWHSKNAKERLWIESNKETRQCYCGNSFRAYKFMKGKFCSLRCQDKARPRPKEWRTCQICGNKFWAVIYRSGQTCSQKCASKFGWICKT